MATATTIGLTLGVLVILQGSQEGEAFIKAAIGLRLGYSPAEKGYGKPPLVHDLHSEAPILKGHFLTGVHAAPSSSQEQVHHGNDHNKGHGHHHGHGSGHEQGHHHGHGSGHEQGHGQGNQGHGHDHQGHGHGYGHGFDAGSTGGHGSHGVAHAHSGEIEHGHQGQGQSHSYGHGGGGHGHGGGGNSGLLRHLKILGVNLYLGGPKDSKWAPKPQGQVLGQGQQEVYGQGHGYGKVVPQLYLTGPRTPEQEQHLQLGRGPRGQYSPPQSHHHHPFGSGQIQGHPGQGHGPLVIDGQNHGRHNHGPPPHVVGEVRGIDAQNELGGEGHEGSGFSFPAGSEVFQPAASQYPPYPPHLNGVHKEMFQEFINPGPPSESGPSAQGQQQNNGPTKPEASPQQTPQNGNARPGPPPPRKGGFSLASLMKGPQWASNLLRLSPLKIHYGRSPPPYFPPTQTQPQNQPNQNNPNFAHQHTQGQQGPLPITSQSSPSVQFSTLFSTNPTPNPPHPSIHQVMPASASAQPNFYQPPAPSTGSAAQTPPASSNANPFPGYPYAPGPQNQLLLASGSAYPHPIQGQTGQGQVGSSGPGNNYYNSPPHPQPQPEFFSREPQMQLYPHPNQVEPQFSLPPRHQQAQTLPEFNGYESEGPFNDRNPQEGPGSYDGRPPHPNIPDDMRPPEGFQYSHSETSPIMSMGMQSYDDPPVMMDMGDGQGQQGRHFGNKGQRQGQGQQYRGQGQDGPPSGAREISESEYNAFISAPTNTHTQTTTQIQAPSSNRIKFDNFEHLFGSRQPENKEMHKRRDHLASSLRNWNPFLNKGSISRNFDTAAAASTSAEAKPATSAPVKKWVPIIRRSTVTSQETGIEAEPKTA